MLRSVYNQLQKILIILISRIYDWLSIWFHYSITLKIYQTKTGLYNSYKIKLMHKVNKNILSPLVLSKKSWHFCIAFQTGRHNWIFMFYGVFFHRNFAACCTHNPQQYSHFSIQLLRKSFLPLTSLFGILLRHIHVYPIGILLWTNILALDMQCSLSPMTMKWIYMIW